MTPIGKSGWRRTAALVKGRSGVTRLRVGVAYGGGAVFQTINKQGAQRPSFVVINLWTGHRVTQYVFKHRSQAMRVAMRVLLAFTDSGFVEEELPEGPSAKMLARRSAVNRLAEAFGGYRP